MYCLTNSLLYFIGRYSLGFNDFLRSMSNAPIVTRQTVCTKYLNLLSDNPICRISSFSKNSSICNISLQPFIPSPILIVCRHKFLRADVGIPVMDTRIFLCQCGKSYRLLRTSVNAGQATHTAGIRVMRPLVDYLNAPHRTDLCTDSASDAFITHLV